EILRAKDEAFVISFDVNVDLLQDFTNSVHDLKVALNKARINTGGGGGPLPGLGGGPIPTSTPRGTLLYDAIYLASHDELSHEVGRKAMIILTDGEDQGSQYNIGYTPTNSKRDGTFRKVEIKAKQQGYKVQARSGYYAMIRE